MAEAGARASLEPVGAPPTTRRRVPRGLGLLLLALLPTALLFLIVALPLLSGPRWLDEPAGYALFLSEIGLPWIALVYLSYGGAVVVGAFWRTREERPRRLALGLTLLGGFALFVLSIQPAVALRWHLLGRIAVRARPLIAALERFRKDEGRYPASLDRLTPRYLKRVPGTGASIGPEFDYTRADPDDSYGRGAWLAELHAGYDLSVHCPAYLISFDSMHYWPSQQYPERIPGGEVVRKIDGWVYVSD